MVFRCGDGRPFVAQRASPRAGVHARGHVQQAVKEGRLLHHAPHITLPPRTRTLAHAHVTQRPKWTLTAKAYMSLRKHLTRHHVHAGVHVLLVCWFVYVCFSSVEFQRMDIMYRLNRACNCFVLVNMNAATGI